MHSCALPTKEQHRYVQHLAKAILIRQNLIKWIPIKERDLNEHCEELFSQSVAAAQMDKRDDYKQ